MIFSLGRGRLTVHYVSETTEEEVRMAGAADFVNGDVLRNAGISMAGLYGEKGQVGHTAWPYSRASPGATLPASARQASS